MRPTVFLLGAVALTAIPSLATGQDNERREREVYARALGDRVNVWSLADDRDRPVLGISLAPSRGRADTLGVRVLTVTDDGPAAKAGIEEGDRIISIDGTALRVDPADAEDPMFRDLASRRLQRALAKHKVGDEVSLVVRRGSENRTVRVKTVAAADLRDSRSYAYGFGPEGTTFLRGSNARDWADSVRARAERRPVLGLSVGTTGGRRDTLGLFVSAVAPDGPAEKAGIVEGARIAAINGVDVRIASEDADDPEFATLRSRRFSHELEKAKVGDDVTLRVWQNGAYRNVTVKAGRSSDVYKNNRRGFGFSFGEGDGVFVMPPATPVAPLAPSMPMAPRAPLIHAFPRTRIIETSAEPLARVRALTSIAPRIQALRAAPRAPTATRARRTVEL